MDRLSLTLEAIKSQTLHPDRYEVVIIDNASEKELSIPKDLGKARIVRENRQGLTYARLRGVEESDAEIVLFVDDDNVLERTYLESVDKIFLSEKNLGAIGGIIDPVWSGYTPPPWISAVADLLAIRNLGSESIRGYATDPLTYPAWAPVGAGMAARRTALAGWSKAVRDGNGIADRTGTSLSSGGDNDIVLHIMREGWSIGYEPSLTLHHLIPETRTTVSYLGPLAEAIMISWVGILNKHGIRPWTPAPKHTVPLRLMRAYFRFKPWKSPINTINWRKARGQIIGRSRLA